MTDTTFIKPPSFAGRETRRIMRAIDQHAACGYGAESEPYRTVMKGCADGAKMRDTTPFFKLSPAMLIAFAVIIALPVGMTLGAASKSCACTGAGR